MDDKPEDWKKWERIKAEREKALNDDLNSDKANLQYLGPESFSVQKGLTHNIEAYRKGSEKISGICLAAIIFGAILDAILTFVTTHLHMGLADIAPAIAEAVVYFLLVILPVFASVFAAIEAIIYSVKARKKLVVPLINVAITIVIFLVYLKIRELIIVNI